MNEQTNNSTETYREHLWRLARECFEGSWRVAWATAAVFPVMLLSVAAGIVISEFCNGYLNGIERLPLKQLNRPAGPDWQPYAEVIEGEATLVWRDADGEWLAKSPDRDWLTD